MSEDSIRARPTAVRGSGTGDDQSGGDPVADGFSRPVLRATDTRGNAGWSRPGRAGGQSIDVALGRFPTRVGRNRVCPRIPIPRIPMIRKVEVRHDAVRRQCQGRRRADQGLGGGRGRQVLVVDFHGELCQHRRRMGERDLRIFPLLDTSRPSGFEAAARTLGIPTGNTARTRRCTTPSTSRT